MKPPCTLITDESGRVMDAWLDDDAPGRVERFAHDRALGRRAIGHTTRHKKPRRRERWGGAR